MNLVPSQRILRGTAATLEVTLLDSEGNPANATGAITVGVVRADGTELLPAGTATDHADDEDGVYTVDLTPAQTAQLDLLTSTWTDGTTHASQESLHEIAGGFFFSLPEARKSDPILRDGTKYTDSDVLDIRREVEDECEDICGVAFVRRFLRAQLDGDGTSELQLPDPVVRTVRAVRVYSSPTVYRDLTSDQLAAIVVGDDSILRRTDLVPILEGRGNVFVAYEHGLDRPPADIKRASLTRLRYRLNATKSGIPDRATSFVSGDGGTFSLATASTYKTGIPDVDAVYSRYSELFRGDAARPASGRFDLDPQWGSIFHGGRR